MTDKDRFIEYLQLIQVVYTESNESFEQVVKVHSANTFEGVFSVSGEFIYFA